MEEKTLTPLKAIRAKCLECCCGSASEVKQCTVDHCPLYCYRDGHNPSRRGIGDKHIDNRRLSQKNRQ